MVVETSEYTHSPYTVYLSVAGAQGRGLLNPPLGRVVASLLSWIDPICVSLLWGTSHLTRNSQLQTSTSLKLRSTLRYRDCLHTQPSYIHTLTMLVHPITQLFIQLLNAYYVPGPKHRVVKEKNLVKALKKPSGAYSVLEKTNNHSNKYMVTN